MGNVTDVPSLDLIWIGNKGVRMQKCSVLWTWAPTVVRKCTASSSRLSKGHHWNGRGLLCELLHTELSNTKQIPQEVLLFLIFRNSQDQYSYSEKNTVCLPSNSYMSCWHVLSTQNPAKGACVLLVHRSALSTIFSKGYGDWSIKSYISMTIT